MVGGNNMSSSCYQQQQIEEHVGSTSSLNTQSSGLFGTGLVLIIAGLKIPELVKKLGPLLTCPICLDILRNTTVTECLHRFCSECIKNSIYKSNRQCPICRRKIVSKRNLRPDPNIDSLIDTIWPNRYVHERVIMDSNYKTPIKFDPDSSNNNATIGDFSSSEDDFSSDNSKDNDFSSSSDDL